MPNIEIEIDITDIYWECKHHDKQWLVTKLQDDGYLEEMGLRDSNDRRSVIDEEWRDVMQKLLDNQIQLTSEQEDVIKTIAKGIS